MSDILAVQQLTKTFRSGQRELTVLHDVTFTLPKGDSLSIVGPSGSGKTTLLGLCAGLDRPSTGRVVIDGTDITALTEDERAAFRAEKVGFVFQNFQLIPTLTALENVMVPVELQGGKMARNKALELLEKVGLADRAHHYPTQLSGGEQQRVAIARAFANQPRILFADEPTGNLDDTTSEKIESLLFDLNRQAGTTLVLVTHDLELAQRTGHIIRLKGGHIVATGQPTA